MAFKIVGADENGLFPTRVMNRLRIMFPEMRSTAPSSSTATSYIDISVTPPVLRGWNGSAWVALTAETGVLPTTGLLSRWSASNIDTNYSNGQGVYQLNPLNGDIVLQESNTPPTYVKSGINGKAGLLFNGSTNKLSYSAGSSQYYSVSQPYTIVAIVRPLDASSGNTQQIANFNGPEMAMDSNNYTTYAGNATVRGGTVTSAGHLVMMGFDSGGATTIAVDGTNVATGNAGTNAMASIRIGAHPNNVWYYNGELYELIVYNRNLLNASNSSDLNSLKAWARQQFGLTIS